CLDGSLFHNVLNIDRNAPGIWDVCVLEAFSPAYGTLGRSQNLWRCGPVKGSELTWPWKGCLNLGPFLSLDYFCLLTMT
ncbi:hypothetical protein ACQP3J_32925, partial [Escherichia coli]